MPGVERLFRRVYQPEIHDLDAVAHELVLDDGEVTFEPFLEPCELRPVGVEADAEESDFSGVHGSMNKSLGFRRCGRMTLHKVHEFAALEEAGPHVVPVIWGDDEFHLPPECAIALI